MNIAAHKTTSLLDAERLFNRVILLSCLVFCGSSCRDAVSLSAPVNSAGSRSLTLSHEDDPAVENKSDSVEYNAARAPLPRGLLNHEQSVVLFAPDDPTITIELALIDRVINDCREALEGDLCRIRYAVYNLTSEQITQKLIEAAKSGVDVQVLIEADQLSPSRDWNLINERFTEAGLHVEYDHRLLTDEERERAQLIGAEGDGLMHLKMRLFEAPTWRRLLTGSLNPNTTSHLNDETLHMVTDEDVIDQYAVVYDTILHDWPIYNDWWDEAPINVLFTPSTSGPRAIDQIFKWISEEREQILIMVFALRNLKSSVDDQSLAELLIEKSQSGVPVYVITDQKQSDGVGGYQGESTGDEMDDLLRAGGVHVYEALNEITPYTAMHHKVAVLGRSRVRVITGAANWSRSGLGSRDLPARNTESLLFIDSLKLDENATGHRFIGQWIKTLRRYGHQSEDRDQELSVEDLLSILSSAADWPIVDYSFQVKSARSSENESLAVTGDLEQLGWWGLAGYHSLEWVEGSSEWRSPIALSASLGASVNWKIVSLKSEGGIDRWEPNRHREAVLTPPIMTTDHLLLKGLWR